MTTITRIAVVETLNALVEEFGADYMYEQPAESGGLCVNTNIDGTPSCIVGHVIGRLSPDDLARLHAKEWSEDWDREGDEATLYAGEWAVNALQDVVPTLTIQPDALAVLKVVQGLQDTGSPWGVAVEKAVLA